VAAEWSLCIKKPIAFLGASSSRFPQMLLAKNAHRTTASWQGILGGKHNSSPCNPEKKITVLLIEKGRSVFGKEAMTVCHTSVRFFFLWWVLGLCACKAGAHKALYCLSHTSSSHLLDFASQKFYS
jgi:hypothetical protein